MRSVHQLAARATDQRSPELIEPPEPRSAFRTIAFDGVPRRQMASTWWTIRTPVDGFEALLVTAVSAAYGLSTSSLKRDRRF